MLNKIIIKQIPTGKWKENCYIVSKPNREALIIDPGDNNQIIENYIDNNDFNISAILNTHGHYDHIGAVEYLKEKYGLPFFLHSGDESLLRNANLYIKLFDGSDFIKIPSVDYFFDQSIVQDIIKNFNIEVIFTPGHTQGSVCLLIDGHLFTGDTLLKGEIGRTDLPGGDKEVLNTSLKIISKMPTEINFFPGHGISSTIGYELEYNESFIKAIK